LSAGQLEIAYQSTSADFQAHESFPQFRERVSRSPIPDGRGARNDVRILMDDTSKQAFVVYSLAGPTDNGQCTVTLLKVGGKWQVYDWQVDYWRVP
jgi:hypothetical protein